MAKRVEVSFVDEGASAQFLLHEREAPLTCATIWEVLREPLVGPSGHGKWSGTVSGILLDPTVIAPEENTTTFIQTGDVMYTHYRPNVRHGFPDALSEIYWAYDRYARPTVPGLGTPAVANIFGQFVGDCSAFYAVCRRLPTEGSKRLRLVRVPE